MFQSLEIFELATARARHASERQTLVARNVANADTPGYRAQALPSFEEAFRASSPNGHAQLDLARRIDAPGPASPNGNTVSLELEMVRGVDAQRSHSRALMVYQSAMNVLRTSLGR